jgi:hypothetical protein
MAAARSVRPRGAAAAWSVERAARLAALDEALATCDALLHEESRRGEAVLAQGFPAQTCVDRQAGVGAARHAILELRRKTARRRAAPPRAEGPAPGPIPPDPARDLERRGGPLPRRNAAGGVHAAFWRGYAGEGRGRKQVRLVGSAAAAAFLAGERRRRAEPGLPVPALGPSPRPAPGLRRNRA